MLRAALAGNAPKFAMAVLEAEKELQREVQEGVETRCALLKEVE